MISKKNLLIGIGSIIGVYVIGAIIYSQLTPTNVFVADTKLKTVNYSKLEESLDKIITNKKVTIKDEQGEEKKYSLAETGVGINTKNAEELKKRDSLLFWINVKKNDLTTVLLDFNQENISEAIEKKIIGSNESSPENAYITYQKGKYIIVPEVHSNAINKNELAQGIIEKIKSQQYTIDIKDYYKQPEIFKKDLEANLEKINKVIDKNFALIFGEEEIELDRAVVAKYLMIDEKGNCQVDKEGITAFITSLAVQNSSLKYTNNQRIETNYLTGSTPQEFEKQLLDIKIKDVKVEVPVDKKVKKITQKALGKNKTYIEVNLQSQYLWYYKDGKLELSTPVVTGDESNDWGTPAGEFEIFAMQTDQVLNGSTVGFDYMYPVKYWMPFNGGVGFHDTPERGTSEYGSDTYLVGGGSHGCINMPPEKAKQLFESAKNGTKVYVTK